MLLLAGDPEDLTLAYVEWLARRRGLVTVRLPEQTFGIEWWVDVDEASGGFELVHGEPVELTDDTATFVRLNPEPALPQGFALSERAAELYVRERRSALAYLLDRFPGRVANPPSAGRSNGTKPLHMTELAAAGFDVPPWIVGNDPRRIRELAAARPAGLVAKSVSGLRSHVRLVDDELLDRVAAGSSPVVIQHLVTGYEVRVHVVGPRVFGSRVDADAIDYRFDDDPVRYSPWPVPRSVADRCRAHAASEGLLLAGLDFRIDGDGRWWCLEMNPVPTFLPYEASTGHAIGDAVLDALAGSRCGTGDDDLVDTSPLAAFTALLDR